MDNHFLRGYFFLLVVIGGIMLQGLGWEQKDLFALLEGSVLFAGGVMLLMEVIIDSNVGLKG